MRLGSAIAILFTLAACAAGPAATVGVGLPGAAKAAQFAQAPTDHWFESSDGVRLHYEEAGRGPTLVFVPGWTMPAWIFQAQIADLSRRYRVVAFDPRSQGESEVASSGHEPYRRGQDIAELIAQLGPAPVVLAGWSLGVLDVLAYVHENGDRRLAGLILVDNSVGEDPPPAPERIAVSHGGGRHRRVISREEAMRSFVAGMFRRPESADYIARLTEACLRTPPAAAAALLSYPVPRSYWKEAVYSTSRPVLYMVTPRLAGQAANLGAHHPSAEAIVLRDVGHAMFVDDPGEFDAIVTSFLARRVWPRS